MTILCVVQWLVLIWILLIDVVLKVLQCFIVLVAVVHVFGIVFVLIRAKEVTLAELFSRVLFILFSVAIDHLMVLVMMLATRVGVLLDLAILILINTIVLVLFLAVVAFRAALLMVSRLLVLHGWLIFMASIFEVVLVCCELLLHEHLVGHLSLAASLTVVRILVLVVILVAAALHLEVKLVASHVPSLHRLFLQGGFYLVVFAPILNQEADILAINLN